MNLRNNLSYVTASNDAGKCPKKFVTTLIGGVPTSNVFAYSCIFNFFSLVSVVCQLRYLKILFLAMVQLMILLCEYRGQGFARET